MTGNARHTEIVQPHGETRAVPLSASAPDPTPRAAGTDTIVVGVDGSETSLAALRWAVDEARLRAARVLAVHAWLAPDVALWRHGALPGYEQLRRDARGTLDAAVEPVARTAPDVEIERQVVEAIPSDALLAASEGAQMLVVGSRGLGGFAGSLLGSVGQHCARHARCPVVIVPHGERGQAGAPSGGRAR